MSSSSTSSSSSYYIEDIIFTSSDLNEANKFMVYGVRLGGFVVEDNEGNLCLPDQKMIFDGEEDIGVEIDFDGWTIDGNWKIRIIRGERGLTGLPGADGDLTVNKALEYIILFT